MRSTVIKLENHYNKKYTIVMDSSTRDKLKSLGAKGETYEDIILKLMTNYNDMEIEHPNDKTIRTSRGKLADGISQNKI